MYVNCDISEIDDALLCKGRLFTMCKFDKLLQHLGYNYETDEPMSLAEIYNLDVDNNNKVRLRKPVGFNVST